MPDKSYLWVFFDSFYPAGIVSIAQEEARTSVLKCAISNIREI